MDPPAYAGGTDFLTHAESRRMKSTNITTVSEPARAFKSDHSLRTRITLCALIFLLAFGVRLLSWHDTRLEVGKVQTAVSKDYKHVAQLLRQGGATSFFSSSSPLSDFNTLGHPPGYSILIALIHSVFGESDTAVQFTQMFCDALAAVVIFLIVAELLPAGAAIVAGVLAALSPQLAWNSVLLLPDALAVLPILVAVYCLARAARRPRLITFVIAGALIGISCWLRANAMLLPFFLAAGVLVLFKRQESAKRPTNLSLPSTEERDKLKFVGQRWRYALAIVFGTLLIVVPLTIRNAIVFHRFIPLSLGAGQTLLEGIADYDHEGRFNIPKTDVGITKQEAEDFHRPDYSATLFNPDGVERERARLRRGFGVIRSNPFWFAGVMARRAGSMVRLERSRLVSSDPPLTHSLDLATMSPVGTLTSDELMSSGLVLSPQAKVLREPGNNLISLTGDDSKYGEQFAAGLKNLRQDTNYLLAVPVKIERGRMRIGVTDFGGNPYASTVVETIEPTRPEDQPVNLAQLPFITSSNQKVQLLFRNEASTSPNPVVKIGTIKIYELGPTRFLWTRYPRFFVHGIQKVFLTAVMLPLAILGLILLVVKKRWPVLIVLLVVPVYFFCVQSIVHTEYRYVLAVDYFLFALVGVTVWTAISLGRARYSLLGARTSRPH
jgi:hypothetical protein